MTGKRLELMGKSELTQVYDEFVTSVAGVYQVSSVRYSARGFLDTRTPTYLLYQSSHYCHTG